MDAYNTATLSTVRRKTASHLLENQYWGRRLVGLMPEIVIHITMVADDESAMTFACKLLAQESPVTGNVYTHVLPAWWGCLAYVEVKENS